MSIYYVYMAEEETLVGATAPDGQKGIAIGGLFADNSELREIPNTKGFSTLMDANNSAGTNLVFFIKDGDINDDQLDYIMDELLETVGYEKFVIDAMDSMGLKDFALASFSEQELEYMEAAGFQDWDLSVVEDGPMIGIGVYEEGAKGYAILGMTEDNKTALVSVGLDNVNSEIEWKMMGALTKEHRKINLDNGMTLYVRVPDFEENANAYFAFTSEDMTMTQEEYVYIVENLEEVVSQLDLDDSMLPSTIVSMLEALEV